ncbi:MAG: ABC transporter ATP-binding protein [Betaproteobacteria bacterium]|jgi:lipoprotein-releasing system ATP-binding protein|nr:ABC transporter ATP-binding protein [Betaproteobacteria bacterium]
MDGALVRLEGLRKVYNEGLPNAEEVLHGIDLTLAPGEFTALIGPSGSGKSTLLNILGLLEGASGGRYALAGRDVTVFDDDERTRARHEILGFIFQFHHLLPAFSAAENVMLPGLISRGRDNGGGDLRAKALELLDAVGLKEAADKKPGELSGGMQQRVAIARALVRSPRLVLADEPTGNLDTRSSDSIFALLRSFNRERGTGFLIVTHDPGLAARCDRIIELVDGRIADDRPNQAV